MISYFSDRGGAEVYAFWINQDIVVPVAEFVALIQQAVHKTGTLNQETLAKQAADAATKIVGSGGSMV